MSGLVATILVAAFAAGYGIKISVAEWLRAHRK